MASALAKTALLTTTTSLVAAANSSSVLGEEKASVNPVAQSIIDTFNLQPISINRPGFDSNEKKHGKEVKLDMGGQGWDFAVDWTNDNNIGLSYQGTIQLALAWSLPMFLDLIDDFTLVSAAPRLDWEAVSDFRITAHMKFIEATLHFDLFPYIFTPFDFLFRMDAQARQRYCIGFDYYARAMVSEIKVEYRVQECIWGLIGHVTGNDSSDCFWRSYQPEQPIYQIQVTDFADVFGTYMRYKCMNWYTAEWQEWPLSKEYIDTFRPSYNGNGDSDDDLSGF